MGNHDFLVRKDYERLRLIIGTIDKELVTHSFHHSVGNISQLIVAYDNPSEIIHRFIKSLPEYFTYESGFAIAGNKEIMDACNMPPLPDTCGTLPPPPSFSAACGPMPFGYELEKLLNMHGQDNTAKTPDYILAQYLIDCLQAFKKANEDREKHLGVTVDLNRKITIFQKGMIATQFSVTDPKTS